MTITGIMVNKCRLIKNMAVQAHLWAWEQCMDWNTMKQNRWSGLTFTSSIRKSVRSTTCSSIQSKWFVVLENVTQVLPAKYLVDRCTWQLHGTASGSQMQIVTRITNGFRKNGILTPFWNLSSYPRSLSIAMHKLCKVFNSEPKNRIPLWMLMHWLG